MSNCAEYQGRLHCTAGGLNCADITTLNTQISAPAPALYCYTILRISILGGMGRLSIGAASHMLSLCRNHSIIGLRNPPSVHYSALLWTVDCSTLLHWVEAPSSCSKLGLETGIEMLSSNQICIFGKFQISLRTLQHDILNILLVFSICNSDSGVVSLISWWNVIKDHPNVHWG